MTLEFLAQIGAFVGTSAVLYYVTQPTHKQNWSMTNGTNNNNNDSDNASNDHIAPLRGIQRYSSYHRIRYHNMIAQSRPHQNNSNNRDSNNNGNEPQKQA
jgi:hypothetical protein